MFLSASQRAVSGDHASRRHGNGCTLSMHSLYISTRQLFYFLRSPAASMCNQFIFFLAIRWNRHNVVVCIFSVGMVLFLWMTILSSTKTSTAVKVRTCTMVLADSSASSSNSAMRLKTACCSRAVVLRSASSWLRTAAICSDVRLAGWPSCSIPARTR